MPWGIDPLSPTDLGEVAQPISFFFVRRLRRRDAERRRYTPRHLASSDDVGFPLFDLFEVTLWMQIRQLNKIKENMPQQAYPLLVLFGERDEKPGGG